MYIIEIIMIFLIYNIMFFKYILCLMQQELLNQVGTMDLNNQHAGKITMMAMFRVSDSNKP